MSARSRRPQAGRIPVDDAPTQWYLRTSFALEQATPHVTCTYCDRVYQRTAGGAPDRHDCRPPRPVRPPGGAR